MQGSSDSTPKVTKAITPEMLERFIGSENWYRHPIIKRVLWTDGVQFLIDNAQCFWLIDTITFNQNLTVLRREKFQAWKLKRNETGNGAVLSCEDGNGAPLYSYKIDYTEFPLPEVQLWFTGNVLMLPTEY